MQDAEPAHNAVALLMFILKVVSQDPVWTGDRRGYVTCARESQKGLHIRHILSSGILEHRAQHVGSIILYSSNFNARHHEIIQSYLKNNQKNKYISFNTTWILQIKECLRQLDNEQRERQAFKRLFSHRWEKNMERNFCMHCIQSWKRRVRSLKLFGRFFPDTLGKTSKNLAEEKAYIFTEKNSPQKPKPKNNPQPPQHLEFNRTVETL